MRTDPLLTRVAVPRSICEIFYVSGGVLIGELAKKAQLSKSTLTSMLDRLQKAGYVRRVRPKKRSKNNIVEAHG
jgi:DNA-binding MarR family transcriptional regulator